MHKIIVTLCLTALILTGCATKSAEIQPLTEYEFTGYTNNYVITFTEKETKIIDRSGILTSPVIASTDGYKVEFEGQSISSQKLFNDNSLFSLGKLLKKILSEEISSSMRTSPHSTVLYGVYEGYKYELTFDKETCTPIQLDYNGISINFKGQS